MIVKLLNLSLTSFRMMGIEETDPRWVGAWWLSFQVMCVLGALGVFPLLILPKVLPESLKWHRYGSFGQMGR